MKKKMVKFIGVMLVIAICFAGTTTSFAGELKNDGTTKQSVSVQPSEGRLGTFVTDNGQDTITVDLVQKNQATGIFMKFGEADFRLHWDSLLDEFEGQWVIRLTNGDKIKGVTGKMIVKKDNFGPINPTLAHLYADEYYKYGTLFAISQGVATGTREDAYYNKLYYNTDVILQWRNFTVRGVEGNYLVTNGERQGTITDLSQYPN